MPLIRRAGRPPLGVLPNKRVQLTAALFDCRAGSHGRRPPVWRLTRVGRRIDTPSYAGRPQLNRDPLGGVGRRWGVIVRHLSWGFAIAVVLLVVVGPLFDRAVFPEIEPGPESVPEVGQVFQSDSEGFTQRIIQREQGLIWSELTMDPRAPGPPPHVHAAFSEHFRVERGTVSVLLGDEVVQLHAGDEYVVAPGVSHRPFNQTDQEAVVLGPLTPEYALPERFGVFLSQAYGFFDAAPENSSPPRAFLQMSRFSPAYDSWLGGPPVALQRAAFWVVGPIARLLGYRTYYSEYAPARVARRPTSR